MTEASDHLTGCYCRVVGRTPSAASRHTGADEVGMTLARPHVEWLSLIRYQAVAAIEQSRQPMPLAMLSINGLHDAVEAILGLVAEHRQVAIRNKGDFAQLFDAVAGVVPSLDHHRARLIALNSARVSFKHHGNVLNGMTIERHRVNAMEFLADAAAAALGQNFEAVSLTGLIRDDEARTFVEEAETGWAAGDGEVALGQLRIAFERLIEDYEQRKVWHQGNSLFHTEPPFRPNALSGAVSDEVAKHFMNWLRALDQRLKLLSFGIDLKRFAYFDAHVPVATRFVGGEVVLHARDSAPTITEDIYRRCHRFVIDTALQLGTEDYNFDAWAIRQACMAAPDEAPGDGGLDGAAGPS